MFVIVIDSWTTGWLHWFPGLICGGGMFETRNPSHADKYEEIGAAL